MISVSNFSPCLVVSFVHRKRSGNDLWLGGSELDGVVAEIVDGVPLSEESVAEDGEWATAVRISWMVIAYHKNL